MYLIELIVRLFKKKKNTNTYNPLEETAEETEYYDCEHIFMPIDSTGEILACTLCGKVIRKDELYKENIFKKKVF